MSGEGGGEAASLADFCNKLSIILGNPRFAIAATSIASKAGNESPEGVCERISDKFRMCLNEGEMSASHAFVRVACKLACSSTRIKPEELAGDAATWDKLVSEFGMDAADVDTLQAYAKPSFYAEPFYEERQRFEFEVECAHLSFTNYPFRGEAHIHLYEQLKERREVANVFKHYSPCVAVVQASGVGKSRAVMQLSELGVYICYCSLAGEYSSASPPRTGKLADQLSSTYDEIDMVLYLKAWLKVLGDSISKEGVTANAWKEQQLPKQDGSPRGDVAQRVCTEWQRLLNGKDPTICQKRYGDDVNINTEVTAIRRHLKDSCSVLFVFDEARGLQTEDPKTGLMSRSPFYQASRALRLFFHEKVFFAVFLDTAAKVSNLVPNWGDENSEWAGIQLLKPIYCLPNMAHHGPSPGLTAEEYWKPEKWLLYGRPLWAARCRYNAWFTGLLYFAEQKLLGTPQGYFEGMVVDVRAGKMTQTQALALLSATAGLSICARSMLPERLAASHMNLILRVTEEIKERRIYVGLSAEPILAEAAGSVLAAATVQEAALKCLDEAYRAGYVTLGPRGEFVTKFILVAAVWKLKEDRILKPIPVDQFLETLLCTPECADVVQLNHVKQQCPKNGVVFFNSFVIIRRAPVIADLGMAFAAGHALMYMAENRLPGADMIIPLWTPKGMTAIVVSAKNEQNASWLQTESVDNMKSEYTHVSVAEGLPSITLLMSLREPQKKDCENWVHWDSGDSAYIHLTCYGIERNYSFLDDKVKALLKKVLVTVPDELGDATETEKNCIKSMLQEQFDLPDPRYIRIPSEEEAGSGILPAKRNGARSAGEAARKRRKVEE